jgi:uncharacterized protein YegP (UPF0339 family)
MNRTAAASLIAATFALTLAACGEDTTTSLPVEDIEAGIAGKADGVSATARFETFTGQDGRAYFHLLAANGQKVLQSQGYASARGADSGVATVRSNSLIAERYEILEAVDGQTYFNLKAGNNKTIATSELYVSRANAERAIEAIIASVTAANKAAALASAKFQTFKGLDGKYYFHLRANNGEIVLQSQAYSAKASATAGTASVAGNGQNALRYTVKDAADGQAYFVLTATNGQVIGVSETYASRANAERGVAAVVSLLTSGF